MIFKQLRREASLLAVTMALTAINALAVDRPNVVIILTDDQGTLDARCFGSTDLYTPAIDNLARHGVRFTQAYAHTVCCPTRAMLMTGRHPQRSNVSGWTQGPMRGPKGRNMLRREVTLAEAFQAADYQTALFGKWHLGAHPDHGPMKQGFDEFFGLRDGFIDNMVHYQLHRTGFHDLYEGTTEIFARGSYFPDLMTDRALSFIDRNQDRPFFLYYAMNIPHYPEQAMVRHLDRYKDLPEPRRSYAAMVSTTDDYIGRVITRLESLDLLEKTIVVFMSDNGHSEEDYQIAVDSHLSGYPKGHNYGANGGGGNTGRWLGAKGSFLEGGIRVPAILSFPGKVPEGEVRTQAITAMDWYPTLLNLCGIDIPDGVKLDGHSIVPLVDDAGAPSAYETMYWQWFDRWAVREGDWKLLVNPSQGQSLAKLEGVHLGNLGDEHPEAANHTMDRPDLVERLTDLHQQWIEDVTPKDVETPLDSLP
ncbi:sulfatase-like hydrolase/transferase [Planctomycetota bacterium]